MSRPLRACGLKHTDSVIGSMFNGRAFTGVWIETVSVVGKVDGFVVAPFTGVWIETVPTVPIYRPLERRALYGRVD